MKVLNLIQCANLGGMEQASLRLMRGLQQRGDQMHLLSLNPIGKLGPLLVEAGIPHEGLPYLGKGGWRSYGLVKRRLRDIQADAMIMTGHHLLAPLALEDAGKEQRILAIHYHHTGVKPAWQWRLIYQIACRKFKAITFPCDFIRREAEAIHPPVRHLAHTVRNPLDVPAMPTPETRMLARQSLSLEAGRPIVGNAGWLIPRKRFDVFLRTAKEVLARKPDTLFVVAGDGPERSKLEQLAHDLGIAGSVRWLGWQHDMSQFYQSIDVLLFNSDWDAMGLTPLEATTYGVPAVCSVIHGGLGEVLNSDRVGFLWPAHDEKAMAARVAELLDKPELAATVGRAGREHVRELSRPEPIAEWHARALSGAVPPSPADLREVPEKMLHRTALIFHRVGPYHFARARAAGRQLGTSLIEVFGGDDVYAWDPVPGADGFHRQTLFAKHPQPTRDIRTGVHAALDKVKPSAVAVPGWSDAVAFSAMEWCAQNRVPAIVMSESTEWDEQRKLWREWIKRRLLKFCSGGLVGGKPHADYLVKLGMSRERICLGYDAVDNDHFTQRVAEVRKETARWREKLNLPSEYFLASARFIEKKNLIEFVRAYARYRDLVLALRQRNQHAGLWDLVLLGDGPLKPELSRLIQELGIQNSVVLPGFKQYDELPAYYGLAKAFIHASTTEQWGLVVNEAMASGLPVLVSRRCGCALDLVREGVNGFTFDPYDMEKMAGVMLQIAGLPPADLEAMSRASRDQIAAWSPDRFAQGLAQAVQAVTRHPAVRPRVADRVLLNLLLQK